LIKNKFLEETQELNLKHKLMLQKIKKRNKEQMSQKQMAVRMENSLKKNLTNLKEKRKYQTLKKL
jgi:hypothetical protein